MPLPDELLTKLVEEIILLIIARGRNPGCKICTISIRWEGRSLLKIGQLESTASGMKQDIPDLKVIIALLSKLSDMPGNVVHSVDPTVVAEVGDRPLIVFGRGDVDGGVGLHWEVPGIGRVCAAVGSNLARSIHQFVSAGGASDGLTGFCQMLFPAPVASLAHHVPAEKSYSRVGIGNVLRRSGRGEDLVLVEADDTVYNRRCGGTGVVSETVFLNPSLECRPVLKLCSLRSHFDGKSGFWKKRLVG